MVMSVQGILVQWSQWWVKLQPTEVEHHWQAEHRQLLNGVGVRGPGLRMVSERYGWLVEAADLEGCARPVTVGQHWKVHFDLWCSLSGEAA